MSKCERKERKERKGPGGDGKLIACAPENVRDMRGMGPSGWNVRLKRTKYADLAALAAKSFVS
jgi:hypothetical protein